MKNETLHQWRRPFFAFLYTLVMVEILLSSCSTKKNTFVNRSFHNITAHYNVYWNGEFALNEGYKTFQKQIKDNYTTILPIYNTGNIQEAGQMNAPSDRALEKGSATIQRHSMYFNKKEQCNWIDDAYLMMGKAYFYKQEYNSAKRTFEFIISNFQDTKMIFNARLWLIRTLDKMRNYNISATEMELARLMVDQGQVRSHKLLSSYNETAANHFITMQEYDMALPFLKNAIQYAQTAKMRQRLQFIAGQIYQYTNDFTTASRYYFRLTKKNTTFDIGFNSRINLAKCIAESSSDKTKITAQLEKMLKETQYKDYRDQIYYALFEIALKSNNIANEKTYLQQSVATSKLNNYQKSLSALTLATILFDERDYEISQAYYDTTLQVLPKDYPNYEEIKARGLILNDLVDNLLVIKHQDSLQRIADMSEQARFAHIDNIIQKIIIEEQKQAEEERRIAELGYRDPREMGNNFNSGGWYFYNSQTVSMGRRDFVRKFGTRPLEDLWIISNKQSFNWDSNNQNGEIAEGDGTFAQDSSQIKETDVKKREYYLQFLPLTPELRYASDSMIALAYFNAGNIYRDRLHEPLQAANAFRDLITRYPDTTINKKLLLSYYFLIQCYKEINDEPNRIKYTNMLVNHYPNSDVARLIVDPDYYKDMEAREKSLEALYEKTYLAYQGQQHYLVLLNADNAISSFPSHDLIPKFLYLKAVSSGILESKDTTVSQLRRLIINHPKSEIRKNAEELIALLTGKPFEMTPEEQSASSLISQTSTTSIYKTEQIDKQQLVFVYLPDVRNSNAIRIRITDFNSQNYKVSNLSANNVMFDKNQGIISIGVFATKDAALKYYYHITSDNYVMGIIRNQSDSKVMIISSENYPIFYQDKNTETYQTFFEKNYL